MTTRTLAMVPGNNFMTDPLTSTLFPHRMYKGTMVYIVRFSTFHMHGAAPKSGIYGLFTNRHPIQVYKLVTIVSSRQTFSVGLALQRTVHKKAFEL